jgi:hypothetical protein
MSCEAKTIERDERWIHGLTDHSDVDQEYLIKDGVHDGRIMTVALGSNDISLSGCKVIKFGNDLTIKQNKENSHVFEYKGVGEFGHYEMSIYQDNELIGKASLHESCEVNEVFLEGSFCHTFEGLRHEGFLRITL